MDLNADLIGRYVLQMAATISALQIQRDALAEQNDQLQKEVQQLQSPGLKAVPKEKGEVDDSA